VPRRTARGSVLILVPAGVLVVILLSAIAVDMGVVYLGQRQLADAAAAAANDAAGAGLSDAAFYRGGALVLDEQRVDTIACAAARAGTTSGISDLVVEVAVSGRTVAVRTRGRVARVFGRAIPGLGPSPAVRAEAVARAATSAAPGASAVLLFHPVAC
jgi:hypothetical protein